MFFGWLHIYLGEILQEADSKNTEVTSKQTKRLNTMSTLLEGGAHFSSTFLDSQIVLRSSRLKKCKQREILKDALISFPCV